MTPLHVKIPIVGEAARSVVVQWKGTNLDGMEGSHLIMPLCGEIEVFGLP